MVWGSVRLGLWVCGSEGSVGLRGLWVCGSEGSVGLWLWVSARSGGLRARVHGGSGGLGSFGEEMRGKEEDKERKREALGAF